MMMLFKKSVQQREKLGTLLEKVQKKVLRCRKHEDGYANMKEQGTVGRNLRKGIIVTLVARGTVGNESRNHGKATNSATFDFTKDLFPELPETRQEDCFPPRLDEINKCGVDMFEPA